MKDVSRRTLVVALSLTPGIGGATVTREPFPYQGRITDLISSEQLFNDIHQSPLNIDTDRIMMCGSPGMLEELKQMFESGGFVEGSGSKPGHFVIEKAFVEGG